MREYYRERSPARGMRRDDHRPPLRGSDDSRDERDDVHRSPSRRDYNCVKRELSDDESNYTDRPPRGRFEPYRGRHDGMSPRRYHDARRSRYDAWHDSHHHDMYQDAPRLGRRSRDPHRPDPLLPDGYMHQDDAQRSSPRRYAPHDSDPLDHPIKHEFDGQRAIKHEFDGQRAIKHEFDGQRAPPTWSSRDGRSRSRSKPRFSAAGPPSRTVVVDGLPLGLSDRAAHECLFQANSFADSCLDLRLVPSRGFCRAYLDFVNCGRAVSFVRMLFPTFHVTVPRPAGDGPPMDCQLSIGFFRKRRNSDSENAQGAPNTCSFDWLCPQCAFNNFASRDKCKQCGCPVPALSATPALAPTPGSLGRTGAADIGRDVDQKVQILVVYPLPRDMDETMFANEMKRLELVKMDKPKEGAPKLRSTAPSVDGAGYGARQGSLHRVFLMRDVHTNASLRYGFAEFWTLPDALAALKKVQMTRCFEIGGTPVTIASIHLGVFVPEERELTPAIEAVSFVPLFNPSLRVRYRDVEVCPSCSMVSPKPLVEDEGPKPAQDDVKGDAQKQKKRKADDSFAESAAAAKKPPVMAAQLAVWKRKHNEIRGDDEAVQTDASGAEQQSPIKFSLSGAKPGASAAKTMAATGSEPQGQPAAPNYADPAYYIDRERLMCLICMMRYKSLGDVAIHEKSRNHQNAMQDKAKVDAAIARIVARQQMVEKQKNGSCQYRDRAKERREAHNQPVKPMASSKSESQQQQSSSAKNEGGKAKAGNADSKGAGMLAKMGWTTGAALGARGEGLGAALAASAYKEGVGLGAEGGKLGDAAEVAESRTTNSYASYVKATKEKARERYNQLG
ncbi:hypothetical protein CDD82_4436 [Ophiocordyceps australis]|uniref:G-patch domain-containing protein n=1 Tax=Ophiocordyceps australis TaxID=1399860 RepID=A0A2C5XKH3_9HYPO|nr:hypothetical protein CDD82_4436 [Ophiocordyceps australis]